MLPEVRMDLPGCAELIVVFSETMSLSPQPSGNSGSAGPAMIAALELGSSSSRAVLTKRS